MYRYLLRKKGYCVLFAALLVANCVAGPLFSLVMSALVDCAGKNAEVLFRTLLGGIGYAVIYNLLALSYRCMKTWILTDARYFLKRDIFAALMNRSVADFDAGSSAEYMNELSNNLNQFENVYWGNHLHLFECLMSFIAAAAICISLQPLLLVLMLFLALLSMGVTRLTTSPLEKSMESFAKSAESYTGEIRDDFAGFRLIRSYGILPLILRKHDNKNRAMETANRQNINCRMVCAYAGNFVGLLSTVLVMAMASYFSLKGMFSAGMVIAFGHLIGQIISPIESMPSIVANFRASRPLEKRFRHLLGENITSRNLLIQTLSTKDADIPKANGFREEIILDKLSFRYETLSREVLRNLSFRFRTGKHYAVIGKSGCGKSTLLSLLLGHYPNYSGSIRYDGVELRELTREYLGNTVAYVSQDTFLFQDTIQNNITLYHEEYTPQEIEAVLEQAGLKGLVDSLPEGLSAMVEENGKNFSGGEKQRFSLARALLRKSRVLLLDEFTANLDKETAEKIEEQVMGLKDCLIITVTHRLTPDMHSRYDGILDLTQTGNGAVL
ncbi:ABC transporter ATP-binding protein [uncultured Acetatifactor sp.]|jgi:ATP-binding cassette subfamily C protein|uniref:ABC transporter ATP-binding protein n=1 Tax=uncultured Acetatifactor sp. TaxID=1671927 RepID=UPI0026186335|nr:ABC transporter ATP-binding protein [uncultured Acetatifactor sp.]